MKRECREVMIAFLNVLLAVLPMPLATGGVALKINTKMERKKVNVLEVETTMWRVLEKILYLLIRGVLENIIK